MKQYYNIDITNNWTIKSKTLIFVNLTLINITNNMESDEQKTRLPETTLINGSVVEKVEEARYAS